ncbi:hypothetical protein [Rhodococcoides corynebacterioides]|uniref:hypothetical protein n=1 Tax=Rhodococcoides corynebacterioides TaxID=53972 RepID=UPI001C9B2B72|nr:hypothetical protein [Rhodococcus corynebacterioides]MBY6351539.1 hypothetical protein [Rhodococcus corynebacterioides]
MTDDATMHTDSTPSDREVLETVVALTASRPALAAVREAASSLLAGPEPGVTVDAEIVDDPIGTPVGVGVTEPGLAAPGSTWTDDGVPTWDGVRDRIEGRSGTALGAAELDAASATGRTEAEKFAERERAGKARLEEIRKSMQRP